MSYIKGFNEFYNINSFNPLLISSTYFYFCSFLNWIKGHFLEAAGMAVVATTSILYHNSYCLCDKKNGKRCECENHMPLIPYSAILRQVDMIPNLFFGLVFSIKAYFDGNYSRIFWAFLGILGYLFTHTEPGPIRHLIYVHLPVIMGFLTII